MNKHLVVCVYVKKAQISNEYGCRYGESTELIQHLFRRRRCALRHSRVAQSLLLVNCEWKGRQTRNNLVDSGYQSRRATTTDDGPTAAARATRPLYKAYLPAASRAYYEPDAQQIVKITFRQYTVW